MNFDFSAFLNAVQDRITSVPNRLDIINHLFPSPWVFLAHSLAFIVILIIMAKLLWQPTKKYMKTRQELIQKELVDSQQNKIESEKNLNESQKRLIESKNLASQIVSKAELEADAVRQKIETNAKNKAKILEQNTLDKLKKQESDLYKDFNLKATEIALDAVGLFLSQKIDRTENEKIISDIIVDLEKNDSFFEKK